MSAAYTTMLRLLCESNLADIFERAAERAEGIRPVDNTHRAALTARATLLRDLAEHAAEKTAVAS